MGKAFPVNNSGARRTAKTSVSSNQVCFVGETIAVTATQIGTLNQLIGQIRLPKGAEVLAVMLDATDMDTNVGPTVTLSIGDAGSDSRFLAANAIAQTGAAVVGPTVEKIGLGFSPTDELLVQVKVKAVSATPVAGTIKYGFWYVSN